MYHKSIFTLALILFLFSCGNNSKNEPLELNICIEGKVVFNNEQGMEVTLLPGDYANIEPMVKHWVDAVVDSYLLLFK